MTKYGIDPKVICQINDLANRHHIKTVILFGSRARGDFRRTSDIDLAVQGGNVCRFRLDSRGRHQSLMTIANRSKDCWNIAIMFLVNKLSPDRLAVEAISKEGVLHL